jgi:AraC family transcriptional regulator, dual regulator of chb operon
MQPHLAWATGLASQPWVRFSASAGSDVLHDHDFVEWFWVDAGRMRHECDGEVEELSVGSCVLLNPRHRHRITAIDAAANHIVMSVEPGLFRRVADRLKPHHPHWPFPAAHQAPTHRQLTPKAIARMHALIDLLPLVDQCPGDAELAITGTLRVLADASPVRSGNTPEWLAQAVAGLDDPAFAARGVSAFVASCHRASAVVCRACRRHLNQRPGDLVERARLDHAARLLRYSGEAIPNIAERCGYASMSHFYRCFNRRFGITPAAYRASS